MPSAQLSLIAKVIIFYVIYILHLRYGQATTKEPRVKINLVQLTFNVTFLKNEPLPFNISVDFDKSKLQYLFASSHCESNLTSAFINSLFVDTSSLVYFTLKANETRRCYSTVNV